MRSIKTQKKPSKKILLSGLAVVLVIATGIAIYALVNNSPENSDESPINQDPPTSEQINATRDSDIKQQIPVEENEAPATGVSKDVAVEITSANQNGDMLQIRTLIQALEQDGTCTLTLSRSGHQTITHTSGTQALSSYSTCSGFNVSTDDIETGSWQLKIAFESSQYKGAATQALMVQ